MNNVYFTNIPVDEYRASLETGRTIRVNNRGLQWNYDYHISQFLSQDDTRMRIGSTTENVINFQYTEPASIRFEIRWYFIDGIAQAYSQAFIFGRSLPPEGNEISVGIYAFQKRKSFSNYIDLLRNEKPLFLSINCKIDEDASTYRENTDGMQLRPLGQIDIRGLCGLSLGTSREDVGEGESVTNFAMDSVVREENP